MSMVRPISQDDLDHFSIDGDRLFWKGQPVLLHRELHLQPLLNGSIVVASGATVIMATLDLMRFVCG